jgi:hypothetical protein
MRRIRISPLAAAGFLVLIALNAACASWIAGTLADGAPLDIIATEWTPDKNASLAAIETPTAPNAYPETLAHPIFFRDRRPYVPPPPPAPIVIAQPTPIVAPPPPVTKPDFIVSGVALLHEVKQAYLRSPSDQNGAWVKEGGDILGWQVSNVTSAGVTVRKGGQSFELLLYEPTKNQ